MGTLWEAHAWQPVDYPFQLLVTQGTNMLRPINLRPAVPQPRALLRPPTRERSPSKQKAEEASRPGPPQCLSRTISVREATVFPWRWTVLTRPLLTKKKKLPQGREQQKQVLEDGAGLIITCGHPANPIFSTFPSNVPSIWGT